MSTLPSRWLDTATSVLLAGVALTRAGSYLHRPPSQSASTDLIESVIDYHVWGIVLIAAAAVVSVGVVTRGAVSLWAYFVGHLILVGCYSIFALSIFVAGIAYDASWATLGEVTVVTLLHTSRVLVVVVDGATPTGRERDR